MVHIIVGYGEVGKSLGKVLGKHEWVTKTEWSWKGTLDIKDFTVVHICIPYNNPLEFDQTIRMWSRAADLMIVHSSVPVGTCDGYEVVHSPIHGVHPNLAEGIKAFTKCFGGINQKNVKKAAKIFKDLGIKTKTYKNARTTEAQKLWSTTQYGIMIQIEKMIYEWCQDNDIDFDAVYTEHNKDYNRAYTELGRSDVVRPYLKHVPGPIGGHCVLPNARLLGIEL